MNILIDIAHPAHVHLIKNVYKVLCKKGHNVVVTVKDIPVAVSQSRYGEEKVLKTFQNQEIYRPKHNKKKTVLKEIYR